MKKFLVLLTVTALALGVFAAYSDKAKETPSVVETTASVHQTQDAEVVTVEATVAPEATEAAEVQTTARAEETKKEKTHKKNQNPVKENNPEVPLSDPTKAVKTNVKVSKEDAKKAVLAHAGLNEANVKFYKAELDRERGGLVYEVEFDAGKYEYDYEVDAETGKVLKAEKEFRD